MNRDHSVIFEIAPKYCILDSFVDHDGYSTSSKGFLPAVVDIMVIWVKFTLWREWCWSWSSSTLATSCGELTHWKRLWCWEELGARGEGDDRGWDGWMASLTQWTWVWVSSGSWWWTGRPGVLRFMGSQRVRHDWATELNWTEPHILHLLLGTLSAMFIELFTLSRAFMYFCI